MDKRPLIIQANSARKWIGEAAHTLALARSLAGRGWPVAVLARRGRELAERARTAGLEVRELGFASRFSPLADLADARAIARLGRAAAGDAVLHCHRGKDHWTAQAARTLFRLRAPLVRTRHVVMPVRGHAANRWLLRRTQRVVCVSEAVRAGYASLGPLLEGRLDLIRPGSVDLDRFRPARGGEREWARAALNLAPDTRVAVLVGRLQRVKGQAGLIEAAEAVAARVPGSVFLLVGDGPDRDELARRASERGLEGRVRLLGRREDVPALLHACDLAVVASIGSEGFSRAALEAMASARPVVATGVGALPEIVADGETGLLVPPGDVGALAGAIGRVLAEPEFAARLGRAGRARAEREFSGEAWLAAHEHLYAGCLAPAATEACEAAPDRARSVQP